MRKNKKEICAKGAANTPDHRLVNVYFRESVDAAGYKWRIMPGIKFCLNCRKLFDVETEVTEK